MVATVRAELGNRSTAWQRFLRDGPLALLPMQRDLFSIVWSTTPDGAQQLCDMPEEKFNARLTEASKTRLGALSVLGARAVFRCVCSMPSAMPPGLVLVGDAGM